MKRWLAALVLSACAAGAGVTSMPPSAPSPLTGKPLPEVTRRTLDGNKVDTKAMRGRVVVVKFFAEYCAPCQKTLPAAEALHKEMPEVAFVGVSEDESIGTAQEIVARFGISFPVIHDAGQILSGKFRVSEMPATFVAGTDGTVRWVGGVDQSEDTLRAAIRAGR